MGTQCGRLTVGAIVVPHDQIDAVALTDVIGTVSPAAEVQQRAPGNVVVAERCHTVFGRAKVAAERQARRLEIFAEAGIEGDVACKRESNRRVLGC